MTYRKVGFPQHITYSVGDVMVNMYITEAVSGESFDVTELLTRASYTTSLSGQAGQLSFTLKRDPNNVLQLSLGSMVLFWSNNTKVFKGYVFRMETTEEESIEVLAYDKMRYLQNHDYLFIEDGKKTFLAFFSDICGSINATWKVGMGVVPPTDMLSQQFFADKSYFDMIEHYLDETNTKHPETRYFIRDSFGKLEINEIKAAFTFGLEGILGGKPLIIGDESLLTGYHYSLDIDTDTCNEVYLMAEDKEKGKEKHLVKAVDDGRAKDRYGLLRKIQTVQKGLNEAQLQSYAKLILDVGKTPTKSMSLNALGFDGMYAGASFIMWLEKLHIASNMYIINATHNYEGGNHTMSLDVEATEVTEIL